MCSFMSHWVFSEHLLLSVGFVVLEFQEGTNACPQGWLLSVERNQTGIKWYAMKKMVNEHKANVYIMGLKAVVTKGCWGRCL